MDACGAAGPQCAQILGMLHQRGGGGVGAGARPLQQRASCAQYSCSAVVVHPAWFADPTNRTLPEPVRELYSNSAWAKYQIQQQGQQQHQHNHGQHAQHSQQGTTAALSAASAIAFEALAAAAGAAYCARVVLLSDKVSTTSWEQQLTHPCRVAFTAIFEALLAEQRERETAKGVAVDAAVSAGVEDGEIEQTSSAGAIGSEGAPTDYRALETHLSRIGEQFVTPQGLLDKYRLRERSLRRPVPAWLPAVRGRPRQRHQLGRVHLVGRPSGLSLPQRPRPRHE